MSFLRGLSRVLIGLVFIVSGFLKAIDPIGTSLKIKEYLHAFNLDIFDFLSLSGGILLSCLEFLIGIAVLKGLRMRLFTMVCLFLTAFFTLVTFYTVIFNPIADCGCFGEAVHLTNLETFIKNIVLLACAVLIYVQRGKFNPIATHFWQNLYVAAYFIFILCISLYSLRYLPISDFGSYKPGVDLIENSSKNQINEYETLLYYSKDGKTEEFTIDNLPDTSWTFVDSKTVLKSNRDRTEIVDLAIRNSNGINVTDSILNLKDPVILLSFYNDITPDRFEIVDQMYRSVIAAGGKAFILNASSYELPTSLPVYYSDYKTILSLNRSNGGATYIYEGVIVEKWSIYRYPSSLKELFEMDPEMVTARVVIVEQLLIEFFIAIIIFMVVIVRFISKRVYRSYLKRVQGTSPSSAR